MTVFEAADAPGGQIRLTALDERRREMIEQERRAMGGIADKIRRSVGSIVSTLGDVVGRILRQARIRAPRISGFFTRLAE